MGPYAVSKLAVIKLAEQLTLEYPSFRFSPWRREHDTELFREQHHLSREPLPRFAEFAECSARFLERLMADTEGSLRGKLVHVRDDIEKLLAVPDSGSIRRVEQR